MGVFLATITGLLILVVITIGILSAIAAHYSHEKNWSKCKLFSSISASTAILAVIIAVFAIIYEKSRPAVGTLTAVTDAMTPGILIAYLLLIACCITIATLNIFAAANAKEGSNGSESKNVWATITAIIALFTSGLVIIFLL